MTHINVDGQVTPEQKGFLEQRLRQELSDHIGSLSLELRVVVPWWLPAVTWAVIRWVALRAIVAQRDVTEADLKGFGEWYGRQIKVIAQ